jgi:Glycosyl hydrolases family 39
MGPRIVLSALLLSAVLSSAQVTIDYGSRASASAKTIPPGIMAAQLGFLSGSGSLKALHQGGFSTIRINADLTDIFAHGSNPDWTAIDPLLGSLQTAGLKALVVMGYTPAWLQPNPTTCPTTILGLAPYYAAPTDISQWAQLTAKFVDHVESTFHGVVTDYEIWNEPDLPSALCVSPDSDTLRRNTYLQMYDAAAPLMKAAAQAHGASIRIGGPVFVRLNMVWLTDFLNDSVASQNVDFVSYHYYLGYTELTDAGMNWDGSGGHPSEWQLTQDPNRGFAAKFNAISAVVRAGRQNNPTSTPVYLTEYNDDSAFVNTCCRNSPLYAPLFNTMVVSDMLNSVYSGAQNVPGNMSYFAASVDIGNFCLFGIIDAAMDCATSPGILQPYPQYYAYQVLFAPNFLNLSAGGNMPVSISIPSPLIGTGFYTSSNNAVVLVNPSASNSSNLTLTLKNPGNASTNATMYLLNSMNWPPARQSLALVASSNSLSATLTVPAQSVVALSVPAQPAVPDFSATVLPQSASIKAGQKANFTLNLAPIDGFKQPVNLSCTGAPKNSSCSLSSQSVTLDGSNPANVTVTLMTQAATAAASIIPLNWPWYALGALAAIAGLGATARTASRQRRVAVAVLALTLLISCGGGGSSGSGSGSNTPPPPPANGTPAGTYTITVLETSGSISHSTPISVIVTQ